jgi:hypothetical protein
MTSPPDSSTNENADVIDLQTLLWTWLKWSWIAVLFALIGAYFGVQGARNPGLLYVAKMLVAPESGSTSTTGSGSRINAVLGIGVAQSGGAIDRMEVMIGSPTLAVRLQDKYGLLQRVFSSGWDPATKKWNPPTGETFDRSQRIRRFFGLPAWSPPDLQSLAGYLAGAVTFDQRHGAGIVSVTVSHPDPEFALMLLRTVYSEADELLREQALVSSRERRNYIYEKLGEARLLDSRQALISILTSEERKAMLLESELPYAARIVEAPYVSTRPIEPNINTKIAGPILLGIALGFGLVTLVVLFRRRS